MIQDEVLDFHDWMLSYHEPFHGNVEKKEK